MVVGGGEGIQALDNSYRKKYKRNPKYYYVINKHARPINENLKWYENQGSDEEKNENCSLPASLPAGSSYIL